MKRKIYRYLSVAVIAVAMAVSVQMNKANVTKVFLSVSNYNNSALAMMDKQEFLDNCEAVWQNVNCVVNGTTYSFAQRK